MTRRNSMVFRGGEQGIRGGRRRSQYRGISKYAGSCYSSNYSCARGTPRGKVASANRESRRKEFRHVSKTYVGVLLLTIFLLRKYRGARSRYEWNSNYVRMERASYRNDFFTFLVIFMGFVSGERRKVTRTKDSLFYQTCYHVRDGKAPRHFSRRFSFVYEGKFHWVARRGGSSSSSSECSSTLPTNRATALYTTD